MNPDPNSMRVVVKKLCQKCTGYHNIYTDGYRNEREEVTTSRLRFSKRKRTGDIQFGKLYIQCDKCNGWSVISFDINLVTGAVVSTPYLFAVSRDEEPTVYKLHILQLRVKTSYHVGPARGGEELFFDGHGEGRDWKVNFCLTVQPGGDAWLDSTILKSMEWRRGNHG